jgi:hypothetical protein
MRPDKWSSTVTVTNVDRPQQALQQNRQWLPAAREKTAETDGVYILYGSAITVLTQQNVSACMSTYLNCNINCHPYDIQLREQRMKQGELKS